MTEFATHRLQSATVFWEDIMSAQRLAHMKRSDDEAARLWDTLRQWLDEHATNDWRNWEKGVWFSDPVDAVSFKLAWAGSLEG